MLRLFTALVWLAGSASAFWATIEMLGAGADLFTASLTIWTSVFAGACLAGIFYKMCNALLGSRVSATPAAVSTPRRSFSLPGLLAILLFPLIFPFTVLRFILVGDPVEDAIRGMNYQHAKEVRAQRIAAEKLVAGEEQKKWQERRDWLKANGYL